MKTDLLPGSYLMKAVLLSSLLFLMNSLSFAQKVYAGNQNSQIYGLCVSCSILEEQNAVGDKEDDYSSMQIPIGAIARIEQTLIFPAVAKREKIIIGIGRGQGSLSVQLLSGVAIETFNGNTSNNDYQIVNNELLKLGVSNPTRGTIEFFVSKPFDRVRVTLNSGLLNLNGGLRIYYAYHRPHGCTYPPLDPIHYYSFNGNLNDAVNGYNMTSAAVPVFQNNMHCGQGIGTTLGIPKYSLTGGIKKENGKTSRDLALNHTVSFWAKTEPKQAGSKSPSIAVEPILDRFLILRDSLKLGVSSAYPSFGLDYNTRWGWAHHSSALLDHYVVRNMNGLIEVFKNDQIVFNPGDLFQFDFSGLDSILSLVGDNISNIITLDRAQIDELVIYDKALTLEEIKMLYDSYTWKVSTTSGTTLNKMMKSDCTREVVFNVSPNPTTGQINLEGNILLEDSEISVRNLSGKEVYHSKLISKTFDLPVDLPGGMYILYIETKDKKVHSRKIILSK